MYSNTIFSIGSVLYLQIVNAARWKGSRLCLVRYYSTLLPVFCPRGLHKIWTSCWLKTTRLPKSIFPTITTGNIATGLPYTLQISKTFVSRGVIRHSIPCSRLEKSCKDQRKFFVLLSIRSIERTTEYFVLFSIRSIGQEKYFVLLSISNID